MLRPTIAGLVAFAGTVAAPSAGAQPSSPRRGDPIRLSIEDALRRAVPASHALDAAEAELERARHDVAAARSGWYPQIDASASYTRTLASEFDDIVFTPPPEEGREVPDLGELPFGQVHAWRAGVTATQSLFDGGRTSSSVAAAKAGVAASEHTVTSIRTLAVLATAEAYFDAALAARQTEIGEASLAQAEQALANATESFEQGVVAQFDVLRAEVARDAQANALVRFRRLEEVARVRLARRVGLPPDARLELTSPLEITGAEALESTARDVAGIEPDDGRAAVAQAESVVRGQRAALGAAKADRWPQLVAATDLGVVDYPDTFLPDEDWRTNWTVSVTLRVPVFDGFRRRAAVRRARADVRAAESRLADTREAAAVDGVEIDAAIAAAAATWHTARRTVAQAELAYDLAAERYAQNVSTQLELDDARLLLQQARLDLARAARDLHVARLRRALLPGLPIAQPAEAP